MIYDPAVQGLLLKAKDLTFKAKDLTLKAKAKNLTFKAKAKDSKFVLEDTSRTKAKDNNTDCSLRTVRSDISLTMHHRV